MSSLPVSRRTSLWMSFCTFAAAATLLAGNASAESIRTVNGVDIDSDVYDFYLETRYGKPAANATAQEKSTGMQELVDLYLLTTQSRAIELAKEPRTKAQLEIQRRGLLAQVMAADYMTANEATEEEIVEAYQQQVKLAPTSQFKARHILVETQASAQEVISSLDGGANFIELAKEKSTGPSGPNGGDLGWFSPEQMVKPFSDAVAALENGSYSKAPVQTQFGWHVILREDSRANEPPTLESVRDVIKQRVAQEKLQDYLRGLREKDAG
jgi:peptidyl-prolyl cis-trans isomerase C